MEHATLLNDLRAHNFGDAADTIEAQARTIEAMTSATKSLMDAGTYLLGAQANKKLQDMANAKLTAALEEARSALALVQTEKAK